MSEIYLEIFWNPWGDNEGRQFSLKDFFSLKDKPHYDQHSYHFLKDKDQLKDIYNLRGTHWIREFDNTLIRNRHNETWIHAMVKVFMQEV